MIPLAASDPSFMADVGSSMGLIVVPVLVALITGGPAWLQARQGRRELVSKVGDFSTELQNHLARLEGKVDVALDRAEALSEWRILHDSIHKVDRERSEAVWGTMPGISPPPKGRNAENRQKP